METEIIVGIVGAVVTVIVGIGISTYIELERMIRAETNSQGEK